MRNKAKTKIGRIMTLAEALPYITFDHLASVESNRAYRKILFSRQAKAGQVLRLKKGMYVSKSYLDKMEKEQHLSSYMEFIANILYQPSYLSLEYILYEHNLLTEVPRHFTSVSLHKTARFSNQLGSFFYHSIKPDLFSGFKLQTEAGFKIMKATLAKALFDFLYLRQRWLGVQQSVAALRLNLEHLKVSQKKEFMNYVHRAGSKKLSNIAKYLFKPYDTKH